MTEKHRSSLFSFQEAAGLSPCQWLQPWRAGPSGLQMEPCTMHSTGEVRLLHSLPGVLLRRHCVAAPVALT